MATHRHQDPGPHSEGDTTSTPSLGERIARIAERIAHLDPGSTAAKNEKYAGCLPVFQEQAEVCVKHFERELSRTIAFRVRSADELGT